MEKRNTLQKKIVLDAVMKLTNHPTAEIIYTEIVKDYPSISKATVYRNLSGLADDGLIRHIPTADGADRFDFNIETPHNHIKCIKCGAFGDAPIVELVSLDEKIGEHTGYEDVTHEIIYTGICEKCTRVKN